MKRMAKRSAAWSRVGAFSVSLAVAVLAIVVGMAQAQPAAGGKRAAKKTAAVSTKAKGEVKAESTEGASRSARIRMPMFYGRLDLDDEQRSRVQQIQQSYQSRADELRQQLEALSSARDAELVEVLSAEQREKLNEMTLALQASRSRRSEPAEESPPEGESDKAPATPTAKRR